MTLLERAQNKFRNKKTKSFLDYRKPLKDFVMECYLELDPASYGTHIQKKVEYECFEKNILINTISNKSDKGDFEIFYPKGYCINDKIGEKGETIRVPTNNMFYSKKNYEFKTSFLGSSNGYTIRNIRPYQTIKGGYVLCFIDCEENFEPEFYVDVTSVMDLKDKMLSSHVSQIAWTAHVFDTAFTENMYAHARFRGYQAGCKYAEGFKLLPTWPRTGDMRLLPTGKK